MTAMFMIYIALRCIINPKLAPPVPPAEKGSLLRGLWEAGPMLGLMVIVLGSIYFGIATPTESAAVGALLSAVIAFLVGRPPLRAYIDALMNTVVISAAILFIALGTFIFNYAVQITGSPRR
jgi:TRAP-type mannitol/chloroaromatic compound transport system permease large subunit